jgi:hypothetical protein
VRSALLATAAFRGTGLVPLSASIGNIVDLRRQTYVAYRASLGRAGRHLPDDFAVVIAEVAAFADNLAGAAPAGTAWNPEQRRWIAS